MMRYWRREPKPIDLFWWQPSNGTINFGDSLGPIIVRQMLYRRQWSLSQAGARRTTLFTVGSVLHFSQNGDTVWGSGINGKVPIRQHRFRRLDVRAVRGPLTAAFLRQRGITVPNIYGDPAQLLPLLFDWESAVPDEPYIVVPNLNDLPLVGDHDHLLSPLRSWRDCVARIRNSRLVIASSLHAIIVAEAFGVPTRLVRFSESEHLFKYRDYYLATGRIDCGFARSIPEALEMGGIAPPRYDPAPLLQAFPYDLWQTY